MLINQNFYLHIEELIQLQNKNSDKLQSLDKNINELDKEKINSENHLKRQLKQFAEDNKTLIYENENYIKRYIYIL